MGYWTKAEGGNWASTINHTGEATLFVSGRDERERPPQVPTDAEGLGQAAEVDQPYAIFRPSAPQDAEESVESPPAVLGSQVSQPGPAGVATGAEAPLADIARRRSGRLSSSGEKRAETGSGWAGHTMYGPYRLGPLIGTGGRFSVFKASTDAHPEVVALKLVQRHLLTDPETLERLNLAGRALESTKHTNVVRFRAQGWEDSEPYLATEFHEGWSLQELMRVTGPFPAASTVYALLGISAGLAAVHRAGFLHGALGPANVFVTLDGSLKLHGFSNAYELTRPPTWFNRPGLLSGSPRFAAPERAAGQTLGPPAEAFSLGVLGLELLSGRPVNQGTTNALAWYSALASERAEMTRRPDVPEQLYDLLHALSHPDPCSRPSVAKAHDVLKDLENRFDVDALSLAGLLPPWPPSGESGFHTSSKAESQECLLAADGEGRPAPALPARPTTRRIQRSRFTVSVRVARLRLEVRVSFTIRRHRKDHRAEPAST